MGAPGAVGPRLSPSLPPAPRYSTEPTVSSAGCQARPVILTVVQCQPYVPSRFMRAAIDSTTPIPCAAIDSVYADLKDLRL